MKTAWEAYQKCEALAWSIARQRGQDNIHFSPKQPPGFGVSYDPPLPAFREAMRDLGISKISMQGSMNQCADYIEVQLVDGVTLR